MKYKLNNSVKKISLLSFVSVFVLAATAISVTYSNRSTLVHAAPTDDSCFTYTAAGGEVTITGYSSNGTNCPYEVEIPSTIGGDPVTTLEEGAFDSQNLASASIPDSVISIGHMAFIDNQLNSISLGNSVETIGSYAFSNNLLTSVTIPALVETLEEGVFANNLLTSISIPSTVTSIGYMSFAGNNISEVHLPDSVTSLGIGVFAVQTTSGGTNVADLMEALDTSDPAIIDDVAQALLGNITYAAIYTDNPSNPHGFTDEQNTEYNIFGSDVTGNGQDDPFGGYIINPAQISITYEDEAGTELAPPATITGEGIFSYLMSENEDNDLGDYYKAGDVVTLNALSVDEHDTPGAQTITLSAGSNDIAFIYTLSGSSNDGDDTDIEPGTTTNTTDTDATKDSSLPNTGSSVVATALLAALMLVSAPILKFSYRRIQQ